MPLKTYRRYSAAKRAAIGTPVLKVSDLYIVGFDELTEITLIDANGRQQGTIIPLHLDRLGNANWAHSGDARKQPGTGNFLYEQNKNRKTK